MKDESAGLLAAAFIGIVPGYTSRSVAGSYDKEAIAHFLLIFTFFLWIKATKQSVRCTALSQPFSISTWLQHGVNSSNFVQRTMAHIRFAGGYAFITNMIPLSALALTLMGCDTNRLYVAYLSWCAIGTASTNITVRPMTFLSS
jgi:dolichyl-diphosphooligosaccharide--protein glycosyltransferase